MVHQHLIANFKMNLLDSEIRNYVSQLSQSDVLKKPRPVHLKIGLAPSSPYLLSCQAQLSKTSSTLDLYAQNISQATQGAHTGEVSAQQMRDCGAQGSIIGHSERRSLHHETPEILVQKMEALKQFKMRAISDQNLDQLLKEHVDILRDVPSTQLIIAYEPKWAIGTGREAEPQHIHRVSTYIRQHLVNLYGQERALNIPLLYGGSVNAKNLSPILDLENINGALVGSASLDLDHFIALIELFINANL